MLGQLGCAGAAGAAAMGTVLVGPWLWGGSGLG